MQVLKVILAPVTVLVLLGVVLYDHFPTRTRPLSAQAVDGASLGRAYAPLLVAGYADAWVAAARSLEAGKSIPEAQITLQETWKDARVRAFTQVVQPGFSLVLPAGTEPADVAKRTEVAGLWRAFAKGLKGRR